MVALALDGRIGQGREGQDGHGVLMSPSGTGGQEKARRSGARASRPRGRSGCAAGSTAGLPWGISQRLGPSYTVSPAG